MLNLNLEKTKAGRELVSMGVEIGEKKGQLALLAKQIAKKFKSQVTKESLLLKKLELQDIAKLGEKLFDFETLNEIHAWIEQRSKQDMEHTA